MTLNELLLTGVLLKGKYLDFSLKSVVKFNLSSVLSFFGY